ncbi:hypothetical protein F4824DRAFT_440573 [Ustulina deusta]|nr:hypothetical protein F4824DRAFT_440573 [Ustulina deusta]
MRARKPPHPSHCGCWLRICTNVRLRNALIHLCQLVPPLAVTSTLYSMQDKVLPWEVGTSSWGLTLGFFYLLLGLVLWVLLKRSDMKRDQTLRGKRVRSKAKAHYMSWKIWLWPQCVSLYTSFNTSHSVAFGSGGRSVDVDETELSGRDAQPQLTGFLSYHNKARSR